MSKESDLCVVFCLIKELLNYGKLIPQSIYIIKNKKEKIKKSLNMFRSISFWSFLDIKEEVEETLTFKSGEFEWSDISGWEVRFEIEPTEEDLKIIIQKVEGSHAKLLEMLKEKYD